MLILMMCALIIGIVVLWFLGIKRELDRERTCKDFYKGLDKKTIKELKL